MKKIEDYFNTIDEQVQKHLLKNQSVQKVFKGYVAAMGASIMQSGLLPTLAFYSAKGGADEDRSKILAVIWGTLTKEETTFLGTDQKDTLFETARLLKKNNPAKFRRLQARVENIAIALKLILRTYPETDAKK
ncbi:MAG: type III-B CRISPR module-associated protein Cmr5 [Bacteroidia bacterium]